MVVALFWLAVFTHVGASLLLVAMGLAFLLVMRSGLWRRLDLVAMLGLCALAPVTLVVLNQVLGTASVTSSGAASRPWTFVGDNLLQPLAILERGPSVDSWEGLGRTWLIPGLIVGVSTVLAGWHLLWREPGPARRLVLGLLCLYWVPVVAIGLFTVSPKERYFLHVHTLGYLFVAWLLVRTAQRDGGSTRAGRASPGLAVTIAIGVALVLRLAHPVVHPDYHAAMAWVATHQQPGEPIVVARPPAAWLTLEPARRGDLVYLAGGEDQPWERRYTRYGPAGDLVDYWVGIDAIVSADELRRFLEANPDAWIVLDEGHLVAEWAYGGEIERVLRDTTSIVQRTPGGGLVLRPA
jgi:hypothetical protein